MTAITRNDITCDFCNWCPDPKSPDPRIHWGDNPREHKHVPFLHYVPELENHFTMNEAVDVRFDHDGRESRGHFAPEEND